MKRSILVLLLCLIMIISGCNVQHFEIPKANIPILMVSHVKEQKLTFIDVAHNNVLLSEDSHFPVTEMVNIGNGNIIATSQSETSLMLYDIKEGTISPFLKLNQGLTAMQYDYTSRSLFVTDIMNDQVHRIDIDKKEVVQSIEVGSYPTDLEFGNEKLFALSGDNNDVTVMDLELKTTLQTFPVLERPSGMYYDGEKLWVGGHGSFGDLNKSIFAYNPETGKLINEIQIGLMPIAFFGDLSSPYFYVLCHGDHALYKVDKEANKVVAAIEVGQNPNFVTGNDETLFVTNLDNNSISIIDRVSFELIDELTVSAGPYAIVMEE
ncbi:YncE family protein [Halalkalibacter lacteus]|uniref:YncE family protein n=1 Tax=Halalkalibacter lacteus TaxID=3090663 RepID=UPI002FC6758B